MLPITNKAKLTSYLKIPSEHIKYKHAAQKDIMLLDSIVSDVINQLTGIPSL